MVAVEVPAFAKLVEAIQRLAGVPLVTAPPAKVSAPVVAVIELPVIG